MVTFVETAEGVRRAVAAGDTGRLIALSPQAECALDRAGLSYRTPDSYENDTDRMALGLANFGRVERLCAVLDQRLAALDPPVLPPGFKPGLASSFWLKVLYDVVTSSARTFKQILSAERSAARFWVAETAESLRAELDFLGESLHAQVAPLIAATCGIAYETRPAGPWTVSGSRAARGPARYLRTLLRRVRPVLAHGAAVARSAWRSAPATGVGTAVILSESLKEPLVNHSTLDVVSVSTAEGFAARWARPACWRASGVAVARARQRARRRRLADCWASIENAEEVRRLFLVDGVDLFPAAAERLRYWLEVVVPQLCTVFECTSELLGTVPRPVLVTIEMYDHRLRAAGQAARAVGAPVVTYQHGGVGFWHYPMLEWTDLAASDAYFTWGPGVDDFIRRAHPTSRCRLQPVGSLLVDRAARELAGLRARRGEMCRGLGLDPDRPTVVYCLGNLTGNQRYLSLHTCSDSHFWATQRSIVGVLGEFPDVQCVVKLHPNRRMPQSPVAAWIRDRPLANCRVVQSVPLEQLLPVADLFVIDAPATAILQMLVTGKRILVFNDFYQFDEPALELLKRSTVFSSNREEFLEVLRRHLRERRFDPVPGYDGEFLRRYALPKRDGRTAVRLARAVEALSQGRGGLD